MNEFSYDMCMTILEEAYFEYLWDNSERNAKVYNDLLVVFSLAKGNSSVVIVDQTVKRRVERQIEEASE